MRRIQVKDDRTSVYGQYTIKVDNRTQVQQKLQELGVPTAVHYPIPLHLQPAYKQDGLDELSFKHSFSASNRVMSLPMHPYLEPMDQDLVIDAIRNMLV